jgi:uncharacterized protein YcbX
VGAVALTLAAINRYPVKSCRGEALTRGTVQPWGLAGDRRWMIVDDGGGTVTAREFPRLLLARPQLIDGGLRLTHPDLQSLTVATPDGTNLTEVDVFGRLRFPAALADEAAHAWFSKITGTSARLVYLDDPSRRPTNPAYTRDSDRVSFADGYPLLLANEQSLAELNGWIAAGPLAHEGPVPMMRFRPNIVVRGAPGWAEDRWRRIRVGAVVFRAVKGSDRCVMTTTDPDTAARGKEPIATLSRYRKWDGKTWFAMNLVPDVTPGTAYPAIQLGDEVEVLEEHAGDGPPR